jgi:EamA domain-containing membrane protein RarD
MTIRARMTAQITRALLCFMMLLTGLSAAEAACPDTAQRQGTEEQLLVGNFDGVATVAHLAVHVAGSHVDAVDAVGVTRHQTPYMMTTGVFTYSSPISRKDIARA